MSDIGPPAPERSFRMPESNATRASCSVDLAVLVDLEARWENLRASRTSAGPSTIQELQGKQRAYEAFHAKLVAYNKRCAPPHITTLLVNTRVQLEHWCKKMGALFAEVSGVPFPAHLLEKAYRLADGIATRQGRDRAARPTPAGMRSATQELDGLAMWCAELARADATE
jgi:hypothetical protein